MIHASYIWSDDIMKVDILLSPIPSANTHPQTSHTHIEQLCKATDTQYLSGMSNSSLHSNYALTSQQVRCSMPTAFQPVSTSVGALGSCGISSFLFLGICNLSVKTNYCFSPTSTLLWGISLRSGTSLLSCTMQ